MVFMLGLALCSANPSYQRARQILNSGQSRHDAIPHLRQAIAAEPWHADAAHWLGHTLLKTGSNAFSEVRDLLLGVELRRLVDTAPLDTLLLLAQAHEKLGETRQAAQAYGRCVHDRGLVGGQGEQFKRGMAAHAWARVLLGDGLLLDAEQVASRASQLHPRMWQLVDVHAAALGHQGLVSDAMARLRAAATGLLPQLPSHERRQAVSAWGATAAMISNGHTPQNRANSSSDCDFARVEIGGHGLSAAEFKQQYVARNRPALIRGAMRGPAWDRLFEAWEFQSLAERELTVQLRRNARVALENEFGGFQPHHESSLRKYASRIPTLDNSSVTRDPLYLFTEVLGLGAQFAAEAHSVVPSAMLHDRRLQASPHEQRERALFYLGPRGGGATFHSHSNAWNALVHGEREWFLYPPYEFVGPYSKPWSEWLKGNSGSRRGLRCRQKARELLWVPDQWFHGVVNTRASVGLAVEVGSWDGVLATQLAQHM